MFGFVSSTGFWVLDSLLLYTMAMQTVQVQRHHEHLSVTQEDEKQYHDVKMNNYLNYDCFPVTLLSRHHRVVLSERDCQH